MQKVTHSISTNYGMFVCVFEPEKDMGGYTAETPAVQGAVSWGKTLPDAKRMMKEAIEGVIETRVLARAEEEGIIRVVSRPKMTV